MTKKEKKTPLSLTIEVDGREVRFRSTAGFPRLYMAYTGRDIFKDMARLQTRYEKAVKAKSMDGLGTEEAEAARKEAMFEAVELSMFEDIAYLMARSGAPDEVPDNADDWLDGFTTFAIMDIMPQLLGLWQRGCKTTAKPKN